MEEEVADVKTQKLQNIILLLVDSILFIVTGYYSTAFFKVLDINFIDEYSLIYSLCATSVITFLGHYFVKKADINKIIIEPIEKFVKKNIDEKLSEYQLKKIFSESISEQLEKLTSIASEDPFLFYRNLVNEVSSIRDFVTQVNSITERKIQFELFKSHANLLQDKKFIAEFKVYLKIGEILSKLPYLKEIKILNVTPPFEWDNPLYSFARQYGDELNKYASNTYNKDIVRSRITIVDNSGELIDVLKKGIESFLEKNGLKLSYYETLKDNYSFEEKNEVFRKVLCWLQYKISQYSNNIDSKYLTYQKELLDFLKPGKKDCVMFKEFYNNYFKKDEFLFLSKNISALILNNFIKTQHSDINNAYYLIIENLIDMDKEFIRKFNREEGQYIFETTTKEEFIYLLKIDNSDSLDIVLVSMERIDNVTQSISDSFSYNILEKKITNKNYFNKSIPEWGRLIDLMKDLEKDLDIKIGE